MIFMFNTGVLIIEVKKKTKISKYFKSKLLIGTIKKRERAPTNSYGGKKNENKIQDLTRTRFKLFFKFTMLYGFRSDGFNT